MYLHNKGSKQRGDGKERKVLKGGNEEGRKKGAHKRNSRPEGRSESLEISTQDKRKGCRRADSEKKSG